MTGTAPRRPRLLVLTSHAIQYQAPLFRAMAKDPRFSLHVLLCSDQGARSYQDAGFGREVKWDVPLLEGYSYQILRNWSPAPNPSKSLGLINPGVVGAIWRGRYDAVMLLSWSNVTTWLALLAALLTGTPVILKPEATVHRETHGWRATVKRWVLGWLFRRTRVILASGVHGAAFFRQFGAAESKIQIAPYAVDNDFFIAQAEALRPQRDALRSRLGIAGSVPLLIFVGKLYPGKRPMDLLRAFAVLRKERTTALLFVGDGESRAEMERWVKAEGVPDVHFAGFQNQSELPRYLAAADVFILPSALETWGLVINEAMCFSLPIITTDRVGAGGDLVHPGENGFLYPVGDVVALSGALRTLVESPELTRRMGERSREIIQTWSYQENLDAIVSALEQVSGQPFPK